MVESYGIPEEPACLLFQMA